MGQYGSDKVGFFLVDGYNLLGLVTTFTDEIEALTEVTTALGDAWFDASAVGLSRFGFTQAGYYDDAALSSNAAVVGSMGAARVVCYTIEGNTVGKHFEGLRGPVQSKMTRLPAIGALHKLNVEYRGNGKHDTGVILHALANETGATGNTQTTPHDGSLETRNTSIPIASIGTGNPATVTTSVPHGLTTGQIVIIAGTTTTPTVNGSQAVTVTGATTFTVAVNVTSGQAGAAGTVVAASTVNGGAAYLQMTALTLGGYTNFAPLIKHSVDNVTYTTLATFAVVTAAPRAQRVAVAPGTTVSRYLAMSWSYNGAGSGQSATFLAGFARG